MAPQTDAPPAKSVICTGCFDFSANKPQWYRQQVAERTLPKLLKCGKEPTNNGPRRAPMAEDRLVFVCPACPQTSTKSYDLKARHWKKHERVHGSIDQFVIRKVTKIVADQEKQNNDTSKKFERITEILSKGGFKTAKSVSSTPSSNQSVDPECEEYKENQQQSRLTKRKRKDPTVYATPPRKRRKNAK